MDLALSPPMRVYNVTVPGNGTYRLEVGVFYGLWLPVKGTVHANELLVSFGPDGGEIPILEGTFIHMPDGCRDLAFRRRTIGNRLVQVVLTDETVHVRDTTFLL